MADGDNQTTQYNRQHHVYGKKSALTFEANVTRGGVATINIDAAAANGERSYDWANKLIIQVTASEMPVVAAVMLGLLPECDYQNYGENNNKGFAIQRQDKGYFVRMFTKGANHAVPVGPEDAFYVAGILVEQLQKQHPAIATVADAMNLLNQVVVPFHKA